MMAWSLLLAAFSKVSALSFQYLFWSRCNATLGRRDRVLYSGIFPASMAFRHYSSMMRDSCDHALQARYNIDISNRFSALSFANEPSLPDMWEQFREEVTCAAIKCTKAIKYLMGVLEEGC